MEAQWCIKRQWSLLCNLILNNYNRTPCPLTICIITLEKVMAAKIWFVAQCPIRCCKVKTSSLHNHRHQFNTKISSNTLRTTLFISKMRNNKIRQELFRKFSDRLKIMVFPKILKEAKIVRHQFGFLSSLDKPNSSNRMTICTVKTPVRVIKRGIR